MINNDYRSFKYLFLILTSFLVLLIISGKLNFYWENFSYWLYENRTDKNAELLKIVLTVLGGSFAIFTLLISYKRLKSFEDSVENQREELKQNQHHRIDERFNNVQQQLGSNNVVLILGALQVLNEISKKDEKNYAGLVLALFTSYINREADINKKSSEIRNITINQIFKLISENEVFQDRKIFLKDLNLINCKFTDINLKLINFENVIFPKKIENVVFRYCELKNVKFIPNDYLNFKENFCNSLDNRHNYGLISMVKFKSCEISNSLFSNITLRNFSLTNSKFFENTFNRACFHNISGGISNSTFYLCNLKSFNPSSLTGCHFYASFISQKKWEQMIMFSEFTCSFFNETRLKGFVSHSLFISCNILNKKNIDLENIDDILSSSVSSYDKSYLDNFINIEFFNLSSDYHKNLITDYKNIPKKFDINKTDFANYIYEPDLKLDLHNYFIHKKLNNV